MGKIAIEGKKGNIAVIKDYSMFLACNATY